MQDKKSDSIKSHLDNLSEKFLLKTGEALILKDCLR